MTHLVKKYIPALAISVVLVILLFMPSNFNTRITDVETDILFKLRGSRDVSDDVVFIYIDSRDIEELGGWPITRDYYGYLTYILQQAGAKVVGMDILFVNSNLRYPEYDADLSQFFKIANNVCLPFIFSDISDSFTGEHGTYLLGSSPQFPIDIFQQSTIGSGFSNLLSETVVRNAVCAVSDGDSLYASFGLECARLFLLGRKSALQFAPNAITLKNDSTSIQLKTNDFYRVRLNHFHPSTLNSMSLIDLFQTFQNDPSQLDFSDKLVFVGVTAPGAAPMKVTPLESTFPASLVHVTLAENIIRNALIRTLPKIITLFLIFLFALIIFWAGFVWKKIVLIFIGFFLYIAAAVFLFKLTAIALPFIFPALSLVLAVVAALILTFRQKSQTEQSLQKLYNDEIAAKESQLQEAQEQLTKLSDETEQLRTEKRDTILQLEKELRDLRSSVQPEMLKVSGKFEKIIHAPNSAMVKVLELVEKISSDDIPVLICGETGTGKEVISRAIHDLGKRSKKSFIAVNCGALPETLLESELFGHEKGAFTGATSQRKGRFELADGGTLFLDEITETTAAFQAKLLRVLQEGTFERLGSERTLKVDVRIIAASSKNIQKQVETELFREDLFYRLNGIQIELPALRDRQDDIPLLAKHFLQKHGYEKISNFSERALEVMKSYRWPGNVRELENTIRRAALLAQSDGRRLIQEIDLPDPIRENAREELQVNYQSLDDQILETLRSLKFSHSSINQTAQALGNKDRGTITEYFRGLCFEFYVKAHFNADEAARALAGVDDESVIDKVKSKLTDYIGKVREKDEKSLYKSLPKKYHEFLDAIIKHQHSQELDG